MCLLNSPSETHPPESLDSCLRFRRAPGPELPQLFHLPAELARAGAADLRHPQMPRAGRDDGARRRWPVSRARNRVAGISTGIWVRADLVPGKLFLDFSRYARVRRKRDRNVDSAAADVCSIPRPVSRTVRAAAGADRRAPQWLQPARAGVHAVS